MSRLTRETRQLLEAGRRPPALGPAHRARLKAAILANVAAASITVSSTTAAAWATWGAKLVGGAALVAVAGGAIAVGSGAWRPAERSGESTVRAAAHSAPRRARNPEAEVAPPGGPLAGPVYDAVDVAAAAASTAGEHLVEAPAAVAGAPAPAMALGGTARGTILRPGAPAILPQSAAVVSVSPASPSAAALPAEPPRTAAPRAVSALEEEVRLLREADGANKAGDPNGALLLLDRHAAAFPRSALEPERAAERVFALCEAGRIAEARADADAFLAAHPAGPLAARVRGTCAGR